MNEILKFDRIYYEKYNTSRINIENGNLVLKEHCKVLKIDKTKYGYQKLFYSWINLIYAI